MTSLLSLLFNPLGFFERKQQTILQVKWPSVIVALSFAVMMQWFAAIINFSWGVFLNLAVVERWNDLFRVISEILGFQQAFISEETDFFRRFIFEATFGSRFLLWAPALALVKIFLTNAFVYIALRFFVFEVEDRPQRFLSTLMIVCYAQAPWVLSIIPLIGSILAFFLVFAVATCGIFQIFKTSPIKAALVVGFPYLIVITGMGLFLFAGLFLAIHVMHLISW